MVQSALISDDYWVPDANQLVTEDDTPVDNFASAKQQRLLVGSLYSSWQKQIFLSEANVGIFNTASEPAIVPDVFLSLDVQVPENWWEKQNRSYILWQFGKPPEVVIEIVSNRVGDELGNKMRRYEQMRVSYYIVFDPSRQLGETTLRIFELRGIRYTEVTETWLEQVGLGVTLWEGVFEGKREVWLRWCDQSGNLLLTGDERAVQAEERAQLLAERLKALGIDPDTL
ncbi:MAG TPA: Uma2 family endonuclease [Candidatus Sericytochromatia bacterium]